MQNAVYVCEMIYIVLYNIADELSMNYFSRSLDNLEYSFPKIRYAKNLLDKTNISILKESKLV